MNAIRANLVYLTTKIQVPKCKYLYYNANNQTSEEELPPVKDYFSGRWQYKKIRSYMFSNYRMEML